MKSRQALLFCQISKSCPNQSRITLDQLQGRVPPELLERPRLAGAQEERHGPACQAERRGHARVGIPPFSCLCRHGQAGCRVGMPPVPACYYGLMPALPGTACGQTALCAARPRLWASENNSNLGGWSLDLKVFLVGNISGKKII